MIRIPAAVLVDQDGTVVDTEPVWERCEAEMLESLGGTLTWDMRQLMVGGPLRRTIEVMLAHAPMQRPAEELEVELVGAVAQHITASGAPWMPATANFMARVKQTGTPIALVTSAWGQIAHAVAAQAPSGGFDLVVAGDEVARPKPAPDAYFKAAEELGVDIRQCVVVEDSPTGIAAAVACGAHVVVIPNEIPVGPSTDYSRVNSLDELDEQTLARIAAGEHIDTYADEL